MEMHHEIQDNLSMASFPAKVMSVHVFSILFFNHIIPGFLVRNKWVTNSLEKSVEISLSI